MLPGETLSLPRLCLSGANDCEYAAPAAVLEHPRVDDGDVTYGRSSGQAEVWGISFGHVQLIKHTVATGGLIVVDRRIALRLTPIQFDLLTVLGRQACEDADKHAAVRGFISSSELLCSLPWDTAHPDSNHLKQLIRRLRRRLAPLRIDLQSRFGFGYRLVLP